LLITKKEKSDERKFIMLQYEVGETCTKG